MISVNKIFLVFLLIISTKVSAQNSLQEQFDYANSIFKEEKYFDAITEFKRLIFFDKQNQFAFKANYFVGLSYKYGGKFDEALKYFTLAEIKSKNDDEYYLAKSYQVRTSILRRTTNQANKLLDQLEKDERFKFHRQEINYWRGWAYIFSDEWEKAAQIFSQNSADSSLSNMCKNVDENMYSEDFAKYSSVLIPGVGQLYTGEYVSGLISLGWNILFGYLTINSFLEDRVFDGVMIGNFLWLRFYSGNIQNAEKFVKQKNLKISNNALDYLQNRFNGLKP
jgi:tetratricopeptide (TPR) repeat protein